MVGQSRQLCREYARTGRCPYDARYGKGSCKFEHVDNVPSALHGVDGIPIEVLGPLEVDPNTGNLICKPDKVDVEGILSNICGEEPNPPIDALSGEWTVLGEQPVFPRRP